jgi:hypothetical protein
MLFGLGSSLFMALSSSIVPEKLNALPITASLRLSMPLQMLQPANGLPAVSHDGIAPNSRLCCE